MYKINDKCVCKTFFLHTIGYNCDKVIRCAYEANDKVYGLPFIGAQIHGKVNCEPHNKISEDFRKLIIDYIESYRPSVSHYTLSHAPNRRYLSTELSISKLYNDFILNVSKNTEIKQKCKYEYFRKVFKTLNISFANPIADLCSICQNHKLQHNSDNHDCIACNCDNCKNFLIHRENFTNAREKMQSDKLAKVDNSKLLISADMQKLLLIPKLKVKESYFSRKLVIMNETFSEIRKSGKTLCIIAHEGEVDRKAFNIVTFYTHFFLSIMCHNKNEITIYADNCSAQNKNWLLFSNLIFIVNDINIPANNIIFNYLETGHTYMSADCSCKHYKVYGKT